MKKLLPTLALAVLGLLGTRPEAHAQDNPGIRRCDFDAKQRAYFNANPGAEHAYDELLRQAAASMKANPAQAQRGALLAAPDVTIPVVIHVLHTGPNSNITDRQINDALAIVNRDFSKTNPDTVDIIPMFRPIIANVGFQFKLAKIDPNGNCTTGITRTSSFESNYATNNVINVIMWDPSKYLNIWVNERIASGAGGYTFGNLCGGTANGDGIVLYSSQFGNSGRSCSSNLCARTLTHEIGHYFGLPHTWGRSNTPGLASNCSIDDGIADTPNTTGYDQSQGPCNTNFGTCTDANGQRIISNVQNYMDYADCEKMFTLGQRAVMRTIITTLPCRINLVSQANLVATGTNDGYVAPPCAPIARFVPTPTTVCVGSPVSVRDYSYNFTAAGGTLSYSWSFPGGTPATATGQTATVTYNTPGFYTITETVTNNVGSSVETRTEIIKVEGPAAGQTGPYMESFEAAGYSALPGPFPNPSLNNWETYGETTVGALSLPGYPAPSRWQRGTAVPAADGIAYMSVPLVYASGYTSTLITPNIDLSMVPTSGVVRIARAYAPRVAGATEQLRVSFSNDCGQTWLGSTTFSATALATQGGAPEAGYTPQSPSDWQDLNIPIPATMQGSPRFKVRFQMVQGSVTGNRFFMDKFRIAGPLGTRETALTQRGISVYPNPLTNETAVHVDLNSRTEVQVSLTDLLGREVLSLPSKTYGAGNQAIGLPAASLSPGLYVVRIKLNGETYSSKLTVN
ncbi:M43 family zinc metalloprotease [Hymenobacter saemangeumensis]|uniref:M43 family zinc metalloprotease n=1 Tax=Hymenobacter saemangeumensis TaxID=1084522 RepID=UPI0031E8D79B